MTDATRAIRRSDHQPERGASFVLKERIRDQEQWYSRKRGRNAARNHRLLSATIVFDFLLSEAENVAGGADWAAFVGESEEAISRERTLWRALEGSRSGRPPFGRR